MIARLDFFLDRITMYRLVLYVLIGLITIGIFLAYLSLLPFTPLSLFLSTIFLVVMCWAANTMLAYILAVPTNVESVYITALILALILDPAPSPGDSLFLGWAAILAISSKYILSLHHKHFFNPAAIAVIITSLALRESASWWVGTASMLPAVLIGGILLVRKLRQGEMVAICIMASLFTVGVVSLLQGLSVTKELQQFVLASPLFFFASVMLTEPLTAPPTQSLKSLYGLLIGMVFVPQLHLGPIYSTPELALMIGNVFASMVSPKQKVVLRLRRKSKLSSDMMDFVFTSSQPLAFEPGQ